MQYLTLLYGDEALNAEPGTPEFDAEMAGYEAFGALAGDAIVGGEALGGNAGTRTVAVGDGGPQVTAGPFAETVEALGGFYVLDAPSLDDVIELARHLPAAGNGIVELRPVIEWATNDAGAVGDGEERWWVAIHGPSSEADTPGTSAWDEGAVQHGEFAAAAGAALLAGGAVQPSSSATSIRVRDGELIVSDGPHAEGVEVVGGVYLLAGTEDGVVDLAARIPVNDGGAVEVRPILELG